MAIADAGVKNRDMTRLALVLAGLLLATAAATGSAGPAGASSRPATEPRGDLRVVNYNILHGIFCDDGSNCQAPDRVDLFFRQLEAARCPHVVGLQEVNDNLRSLIRARLPSLCGGRYRAVFADVEGNDKEYVLTTLPAAYPKVLALPGGLRSASRVELRSELGPVVLVVTHQDGDRTFPSCRNDIDRYRCPKPCPEGTTFATCQTILGERLAEAGGGKRTIRIYMGDFNVPAGNPRYAALVAHGWVDTHLAASNPECDPATGTQCTSGRVDNAIAALKDPNARETERIDFIFVKVPARCGATFDGAADLDGDGVGTGLFAATPALEGPGGIVWPSDHTAVSMDLRCAASRRA